MSRAHPSVPTDAEMPRVLRLVTTLVRRGVLPLAVGRVTFNYVRNVPAPRRAA